MVKNKSAIKRAKQNEKRRVRNRAIRSKVKTFLKKVEYAIKNNENNNIMPLYKSYVSVLDKACKKGVYHKNYTSRKKSRLIKRINLREKV